MRRVRLAATVDCGLIGAGLVLLAVAVPHRISGDGYERYLALTTLLGARRLPLGDYSLIGPVFAAPLWYAGQLTGDPAAWLRYANLTVFALGLAAAYLLLRERLAHQVLRRFLLLIVAGSMVAPAVADFYGETFTTVAVGIGLIAATRPAPATPNARFSPARATPNATRSLGAAPNPWTHPHQPDPATATATEPAPVTPDATPPHRPDSAAPQPSGGGRARPDRRRVGRFTGWMAVTLGAANTPASLIALGLVCGTHTLRTRRVRFVVPFVAGVLLVVTEILLRHGGYVGNHGARTVMPYSGRPGFSYPFLLGVAAIIFSFGRGLVFFIPGLVLPARRRLRGCDPWLADIYLLWMLFLAGLVAAYASWWAWYGGMSWGPRFFLLGVLPAALALAVRLSTSSADPATNGTNPTANPSDPAVGPANPPMNLANPTTNPANPVAEPANGTINPANPTASPASFVADLATLGILVLSLWVGAASSAFSQLTPPQCLGDLEFLCHFTPEFSPLWYPFVAKPELAAAQWLTLAYHAVVLGWLAAPLLARLGRTGWQGLRPGGKG